MTVVRLSETPLGPVKWREEAVRPAGFGWLREGKMWCSQKQAPSRACIERFEGAGGRRVLGYVVTPEKVATMTYEWTVLYLTDTDMLQGGPGATYSRELGPCEAVYTKDLLRVKPECYGRMDIDNDTECFARCVYVKGCAVKSLPNHKEKH